MIRHQKTPAPGRAESVEPGYLALLRSGELERRVREAERHMRDYVAVNRAAVREMHRQVGELVVGPDGLARRGLLVRHLVLPHGIAGTEAVLRFLAEEISRDTYVNLMDQYRPCYRADEVPQLDRPITEAEWEEALAIARRCGIARLDQRAPLGRLVRP